MPSTTVFQPGDLVLVDFPFTSTGQGKPRPALVVLDSGDADVVVARVTTQTYNTAFDVPIADWQTAGLLAPSTVRLHKVATVEKTGVQRTFGKLQPNDRQRIASVLQKIAASW